MARLSNSGTYLLVDNVRVWFDPNTDTMHVTSDDPDFGKGLHVTLKRFSGPDKRIREAFLAAGIHTEALPAADPDLPRPIERTKRYDHPGEGTLIA